MNAYISVFTSGIGYSGWELAIPWWIPKYRVKSWLAENMDAWFKAGRNVYVETKGKPWKKSGSWIVSVRYH